MSKFKLSALIAPSGGIGSHLILDKIHRHKNVVAMQELSFRSMGGTTKGDLKDALLTGKVDKNKAYREQLFPEKDLDENIKCMVLNKPPLKMINYHRLFHPEISVNYIFRNPVSYYYSWVKRWEEYEDHRRPNRSYSRRHRRRRRRHIQEGVYDWFRVTYVSSLFHLAQNFDAQRDNIISFEHFLNDTDGELSRIFNTLNIPVLKTEDFPVLNMCNICKSDKVERKIMSVRPGREAEEVLYCPRHGPVLGPGEYNYIRKEDSSFLNKWKKKEDVAEISQKFKNIFGDKLISYYEEEKYLVDTNREEFDILIEKFLDGLKV